MRIIGLLLVALLTVGCASHPIHFTSEPSGATVSLRIGDTKWYPKGTTPCTVNVLWPVYDPNVALVSFPGGEKKQIDLHPFRRRGVELTGNSFCGVGFAGVVVGAIGNLASVAYGGLGVVVLGWWMSTDYSFTNTSFHVVLQEKQSNPTSEGIRQPADGLPKPSM